MLSTLKLLAAGFLIAVLPVAAQAALITYDFTVTATAGSLAGDSSSGSLSFDDSLLAVPNTNLTQPNLLTDLSFTWNGMAYDASTANSGQISSGATGQLALVVFGDTCTQAGCPVGAPGSWLIGYDFTNASGIFIYADVGGQPVSRDVTFAPLATPLPPAAWLFLSALVLAVLVIPTKSPRSPAAHPSSVPSV